MKKTRRDIVYAFIDSQNLNLGTSKDIYKGRKRIYEGWKLADFLLEKNKLLKFIAPNYKTMSILIKKVFVKKNKMSLLSFLNNEQEKLAIKKPLYRSGNR